MTRVGEALATSIVGVSDSSRPESSDPALLRGADPHDLPTKQKDGNTFVVVLAVTIALLALIVTLGWVVYYRLVG